MASIDPNRDLDIIEWIEAQAMKAERDRIAPIIPEHSPILSDTYRFGTFTWTKRRAPLPQTDDMRQMIEDITNAQA